MKRICFFIALGLLIVAPTTSFATVQIFACEPEWAALAKEIGGDKVETFAATHARQDPHHIRARPSLIAAMRKADLVICSGAGLEVGWLPILLQKAGNANTQPGMPGFLLAAVLVPVLEKPDRLDRAEGDIHPEGNPHVHLNPHNIALVAEELTKRLKSMDVAHAAEYQSRYDAFAKKWQMGLARWEQAAADLKDTPVVVHHKGFSYLLDWLGMKQVASLEPKPGLPPTTAHLESLLQQLRTQPAQLIIRTPYEPKEASQWLSDKTGTSAVVLPYTVGGDGQSGDLFGLFEHTIGLLKNAKRD